MALTINLGIVDTDNKTGAQIVLRFTPVIFDCGRLDDSLGIIYSTGYFIAVLGLELSIVATGFNTANNIETDIEPNLITVEDREAAILQYENSLMSERLDNYVYCLECDGYYLEDTYTSINNEDDWGMYTPDYKEAFLFTSLALFRFSKNFKRIYDNCNVVVYAPADFITE